MIFLTCLYSDVLVQLTLASSQTTFTSTVPCEIYDLGISEVVTDIEATFQRNIVLSRVWDRLLLNICVQNFGDNLDQVFLKVKTNEAPAQATFNTLEQVGLIQAFSYQFEIPQTLVLTLNNTKQTEITLEIFILLDHGVSWRDPNVQFSIKEIQLIALDLAQPLEREPLPIYNAQHQYQIQPVKYSFLKKNLLASFILYVHIPSGMQLAASVTIILQGTRINYITVYEQIFNANKRSNSISFNLTMPETSEDQDLFLTVSIAPVYDGLSELTIIRLSIAIEGVLQQSFSSPFVDVLGSHPVPGVIMFPILLISLFGVPYYLVYREHLLDRDENILDPKSKTKL